MGYILLSFGIGLLTAVAFYWLISTRISSSWSRASASHVADSSRRLVRSTAIVAALILVIVALLELVSDTVFLALEDFQYSLTDSAGGSPATQTVGTRGISWALYLAIFVGILLGAIAGVFAASRKTALYANVTPRHLI